MSNKRIVIILVLLFLLVSGALPKMAAIQTALAQELTVTSPLPSSIVPTFNATPLISPTPEVTVSLPSPTPTETKTTPPKTSSGSTLLTTRNLILATAIILFVFCLVLLLLLRSLRHSKKTQSPTTGRKLPSPPQSTSEPYGLRLVMASGGEIAISKLPASIGRDKQKSDIVLRDDTISAIHANLYYNPSIGKICIEDCSSLNGVFVNERPTRKNVLEDGAIIKLGDTQLTFRDTGFIPSDQS